MIIDVRPSFAWLLLALGACGSSDVASDAGATMDTAASTDGPDGAPACDCPLGQSCPAGDGVCVDAPLVATSLRQRAGTSRPILASCLVAAGGLPTTVVMDGDCRVTESMSTYDPALDVGLATVSGPLIGSTTYDPRSGCPVPLADLSYTTSLSAGEPITLALAGGGVGALAITEPAPSAISIALPTAITVGGSGAVTWTPGAGTFDGVFLSFTNGERIVQCSKLGDSGSLVLSSVITQLLKAQTVTVVVGTFGRTRVHTGGIAVDLFVAAQDDGQVAIQVP